MVTFTCQHCNSSLKKSVVEKHYAFKCRNRPNLTCIDCLKDFLDNDYVKHTSCISEAQKYGGQDFVAKPVAARQTEWLDVCSRVRGNQNLSREQKALLEIILEHNNVPRHRKKFHNFVQNVGGKYRNNTKLIDSVFDILEITYKESRRATEEAKNNNKNNISCEENQIINNGETEDNGENSVQKKKKKKKVKENGIVTDENTPNQEDGNIIDQTDYSENIDLETKSPKKNKKKDKREACEGIDLEESKNESNNSLPQENCISDEIFEEGTDTFNDPNSETTTVKKPNRREKQRKLKKEKYEQELKSIQNSIKNDPSVEDDEEIISDKKEKKRKRKHAIAEDEIFEKKKTKKQEKAENNNSKMENSNVDEKENPCEMEEVEGDILPKKFCWEEVILDVLKSASDNEMSLKRLGKKVVSEYLLRKGDREGYEKINAKFNKKIHKTVGVRVLKDRAKLISCE